MSSKRPLAPAFLNRFDHYLLLNKPEVWSARTHLVLYYSILFLASLTFISFIIPDDPRSETPAFYWVGFVIIISIIALTIWLIYLLRFNVFKRYGNSTPLSRLTTFLLYFIAIGTIVLFPLVMPYVESIRANNAYSDTEVANDINAINMKVCQLEYDSLPHELKADTLFVVNKLPTYSQSPEAEVDADTVITVAPYNQHRYRLVDTASLKGQIATVDSSSRINDSMYVFYKSTSYQFINPYSYTYTDSQHHVYSNYNLYNKVIRHFQQPDRQQTRAALYELLKKYRFEEQQSYSYESNSDDEESNFSIIRKKYGLSNINSSIDNIIERKYRWRTAYVNWIIHFCYYTTLILTLLVFAYRHSTKKAFFLSLLSGVILSILTSLFIAYFSRNDGAVLAWIIFYAILFFVVSLFSFRNKIRHTVTGICINLFVLMVAFLPTCAVSYYYSLLLNKEQKQGKAVYVDFTAMYQHEQYAEIAGGLLLVVLLATYIHKVYRQWYALPEE